MKLAVKWEAKVEGKKRSIQLYDSEGNKIEGDARWEGNFDCSRKKLTSLEGSPKEVGGWFDCSFNKLTSLEGGPKEVDRGFWCIGTKLTSLKGCPKEVGGGFDCRYNKLTSLEGCPKEVGGSFLCSNNPLTSLEGKPKEYVDGVIERILKRKSILKVCRCSVEDLIETGWKCGCKT